MSLSWQDVKSLTRFYVLVMRLTFRPLARWADGTPLAYSRLLTRIVQLVKTYCGILPSTVRKLVLSAVIILIAFIALY
jgi:hypothetical protein